MKNWILGYVVALGVMSVMDAIWLGLMVPRFYVPKMDALIADNPKWAAAVIFYLLYAAGILFFAILPSLTTNKSITAAALIGGAFGFFAYATYDLTNHATLKNWPLAITLVDLVWGTVVTSAVTVISVTILRKFF